MTVTLTSPAMGLAVGDTYTGTLEAWLLANGYAEQAGYTGPGVSNTGATDVLPAEDPLLPENREAPYFPDTPDRHFSIANDAAHLTATSNPNPEFDFDEAGANTEAPSNVTLETTEGPAAGGTEVTLLGDNLEGVTGVTFGGTAGTALDVDQADQGIVKVTAPAHAAGAVDVVVTNANGAETLTGGFTYTA